VQSRDESIQRFAAADGAVDPIEWLDERGQVTARIEDAVEARVSKRLGSGALFTVRLELATLPSLGLSL
jgi:hypothetical protein